MTSDARSSEMTYSGELYRYDVIDPTYWARTTTANCCSAHFTVTAELYLQFLPRDASAERGDATISCLSVHP